MAMDTGALLPPSESARGAGRGGSPLRDRRLMIGVAVLLSLILIGVVGYFLLRDDEPHGARQLPPLAPLAYGAGLLRGDVRQVSADQVTLTTGAASSIVQVGPATRVEALLPAQPGDIARGDLVIVGGVSNLVNSFAVKMVVVIPAGEAAPVTDPRALPRSKGGFSGWETYTVAEPAPEVYGTVTAHVDGGVQLAGPTGEITVLLDDRSVLRRLTPGGVELLHGGDHLAVRQGTPPAAILAMSGQ